ncbi:hypothetical protein N790_11075 [Arenimonas malthae CC-JY-1]|uniref:DUF4197 domain-containing protein n=1 Tax=Arenimonas malthae CC-JY-1 TaxID=1384054 RepID=A0A091BFT8_9GAMM|nr:DUF4197 domain-containing protein [Arenimonas malthae]KFN43245.1 hypothetical protein N790_11075 [Arenimonas malthae CC-JY-1]
MRATTLVLAALVLLAGSPPAAQADDWKDRLRQSASGRGSGLGEAEAGRGLKEALAQGVHRAVTQLGRQDGFYGDAAVRILVPKKLRGVADAARKLGAGRKVDEFELSMNRAAEKAVPVAADIFAEAVRQMTVQDALEIVRGGDDAGTRFFRRVTEDRLRGKFLPIVAEATGRAGVTKKYKAMVGGNALAGALGGGQSLDLDAYVTDAALDGLFKVVAEQERAIRHDPAARTSDLLRRVFGKR